MMQRKFLVMAALLLSACATLPAAEVVKVRKTDGTWVEGATNLKSVPVRVSGSADRIIPMAQLLSLHVASAASSAEESAIQKGFEAIGNNDRAARDLAVEELTSIGLPVLTPLLKAYKDTDQHEPRPLYRLFERIIPSSADGFDRTQSLIRLRGGQNLRGGLPQDGALQVGTELVPWNQIRMLAVRQKSVSRSGPVHSLKHSTQIEYWDSGIIASSGSMLQVSASGFARLSFEADGWASDPNGLTKPGSPAYKSHLFDGQPFGALVGRFGSGGEVFFIGKSHKKAAAKAGRLQLAINDNKHWQNNLGTYTVSLQISDAYDVGDSQ